MSASGGFPQILCSETCWILEILPTIMSQHLLTLQHYECSQHFNTLISQVGTLLYWSMLAACSVGPGTVVVCARYLSPTLVQISQQGICHLLEPSSPT